MTGPLVVSLAADRVAAQRIVDTLVEADLSPRWSCPTDQSWNWQEVFAAADAASCVMFVLGDPAAVPPADADTFRRLIVRSLAANKGIGVRVAPATAALPFEGTVYDLTGWRAAPQGIARFLVGDLYLRDVAAAAKFKSAGRDPPPPAAPRRLLMRHLATVFSAVILPLVAVLSFTDVAISLYGAAGIADRPSAAARRAWKAIPDGDCNAVRAFLKRRDAGELHGRAEKVLAATTLRAQTRIDKTPQSVSLSYVPPASAAFPTQEKAQEAALSSATEQGRGRCSTLASTTGATLRDIRIGDVQARCERYRDGYACMIRATAICLVEQPVTAPIEWCSR